MRSPAQGTTRRIEPLVRVTALLAVALGVAIAASRSLALGILGALFVTAFLAAFIRKPKQVFVGFGVFILLQDALVAIAAKFSEPLSVVLHRADEGAIALMLVVTLLRGRLPRSATYVSILGLTLAALVSSIGPPAIGLQPAALDFLLMLKAFFLFIIAGGLDWNERDLRNMVLVFFGVGGALLLLGFLDPLTPPWQNALDLGKNVQYRAGFRAAQSIFSHPGIYGEVAMFLMLYTLAYYVVRRRMSSLVAAGGFGIAVLISLRVAPIVSVVLGVVLGLLFLRRQRMASIAVLLGIFAVMTAVVFRGPLDELFSSKIQGSQDSARVALWRTSIQISKDRFPFGTGLGTFGGAVSQDYYSPVYYQYGLNTVYGLQPGITSEEQDFATDTHWPYVLGETGVIGLIMYVITLALIARSARRAVLTPANPLHLALALGAFLSFLAALVMAFVTPIFQATLGSYFTLGGAGVAYGAWRSHRALLEREQASLVPEPPERPALRVGAP